MENKISSNYLINKYSYCLYFFISICFYKIILKENNLNDFLVFEAFLTMAYVFWICTLGSIHFVRSVKFYRHDRNTLMIKNIKKIILLSNNEIDSVSFYPVDFIKGNKLTIKIKITNNIKEEFFFHIRINKDDLDFSKIYDVGYFYLITNEFFGIVGKEKISLASSIFSS